MLGYLLEAWLHGSLGDKLRNKPTTDIGHGFPFNILVRKGCACFHLAYEGKHKICDKICEIAIFS